MHEAHQVLAFVSKFLHPQSPKVVGLYRIVQRLHKVYRRCRIDDDVYFVADQFSVTWRDAEAFKPKVTLNWNNFFIYPVL